jgi:hypothetical protein
MWEQTRAKEGVWPLSFFRFEEDLERERERERERKGEDVVCEHKEDRGSIVLFLGVSSKGIKQGFIREREREREEKKKQRIKQRDICNFLQRTKAKKKGKKERKKAKNERGGVWEGIRESDTRGSCA